MTELMVGAELGTELVEKARTELKAGSVEEIVLRHSKRGMQVLKDFLPADNIERVAAKLLALPRGRVLLTTGFYVAGYAETDGPVGTYALAQALSGAGFEPVIVTDKFCEGFFEPEGIAVEYAAMDADGAALAEILGRVNPVAAVSIERCGKNADGHFANMRGIVIDEFTAPLDDLMELARARGIYTVGVGDGGNEIGMGNLADRIRENLALVPCETQVDDLVIASVSNWGAYGLAAAMGRALGQSLLIGFAEAREFIARTVEIGSVDGVTHEFSLSVDGFGMDIEEEILTALR